MTEQEAIQKAHEYFNEKDLYILLSISLSDMKNEVSVPYVGQLSDDKKIIFVFSSYENAKKYIDKNGFEKPTGNYMVARIDKDDKYRNLFSICNTAFAMGVNNIDFDLSSDSPFGCLISWLFEINNVKPEPVSVLVSKEQVDDLLGGSNKAPLQFNSMPVYNFNDPFKISKERTDEITGHIFEQYDTQSEYTDLFRTQESLHENCLVVEYLNTYVIPKAVENGNENNVNYFYTINYILNKVIWNRLEEEKELYTLLIPEKDEIYIRNNSLYVLYTDLYKNNGQFKYKKLNGKAEIEKLIAENNIERLVITDGPDFMAIIEHKIFEQ